MRFNITTENALPRIFLITIVSVITVWFFVFSETLSSDLEVNFFDVGQGDAILIKTPENQTMLIDGGPNSEILQKLGEYLPMLSKRVDIILLTHPHADHVAGLIDVLKRYEIGTVILSGASIKTNVYSEFLKIIK